jgi:hypothetical protein
MTDIHCVRWVVTGLYIISTTGWHKFNKFFQLHVTVFLNVHANPNKFYMCKHIPTDFICTHIYQQILYVHTYPKKFYMRTHIPTNAHKMCKILGYPNTQTLLQVSANVRQSQDDDNTKELHYFSPENGKHWPKQNEVFMYEDNIVLHILCTSVGICKWYMKQVKYLAFD